jgi:hypothetical protein
MYSITMCQMCGTGFYLAVVLIDPLIVNRRFAQIRIALVATARLDLRNRFPINPTQSFCLMLQSEPIQNGVARRRPQSAA